MMRRQPTRWRPVTRCPPSRGRIAGIVIGSVLGAVALVVTIVCVVSVMWRDPTVYETTVVVGPHQQVVDSPDHRSKFPSVTPDGRVAMINRGPYSYWRNLPMGEAHLAAGGATRVVKAGDGVASLDSRLFKYGGTDYLLVFANRRQHLVRVPDDIADTRPDRLVTLRYDGEDGVEKNWAPYVHGGRLHFITRMRPIRVVVCDDVGTGKCRLVHDAEPDWRWDPAYACVRGSSPLVPTRHPGLLVGLAHTAGGANAQHRWNQLVSYRVLLIAYDPERYRLTAVSDPLDLSPLYPCLGLRPRDYVRVHFGTQLHGPATPVARDLAGDWLASVDLFDTRGLMVRLSGVDRWLDRVATEPPVDLDRYADRLARWMGRRLGGLNIVSSWFNLLKSAGFRRGCGPDLVI